MNGTIYINGEIGVDTTVFDIIRQVKNQPTADAFLVKIDSIGGYVDSGKEIYNYLINLDKPITTYTTKAYSIASMIFMAGSNRIIPEGTTDALMIHLPWMETQGNHQEISDHLKDLKAVEDELVDFYSKAVSIDKSTVHSLLSKETFLSATQAKEFGFATTLQPAQLAVAKLHNDDKEEQTFMNKLNEKLDSIKNLLLGKSPIKAELVLQDATGVSITFPDLNGSDEPALDDKAMVDGKPADGEFTMPDESVLKFNAGVLSEVVAPVVEETEPTEEEALNEEADSKDQLIAELQTKVTDLESRLSAMMNETQAENLLDMVSGMVEKTNQIEAKYMALAKQVGSDYQASKQETTTSVKVSQAAMSRAAQMLNF